MWLVVRLYLSLASLRWIAASHRKWIAILGLSCLVAAIAGGTLQLGNVTLPRLASTPSQLAAGIAGFFLLAYSSLIIEKAQVPSKGNVLSDTKFWLKVFNAMPPAFIKEYPSDLHLINNEACRTLQGEPPRESLHPADVFQMMINADHRNGDRIAATSGASAQIELSEHIPTGHPELILTIKTRVEHDQRVFIVGWYVPIELSEAALVNKKLLEVRKRGEQILFQMAGSTTARESPFLINVGNAVGSPSFHSRGIGETKSTT